MQESITNPYISLNDGVAAGSMSDRIVLESCSGPEDWYRYSRYNYPKFFKMDMLCKWAWIGAEMLLVPDASAPRYAGIDPQRVAVVMATKNGSLDVDHRYLKSTATIASPALFVYTLPNIMLGEICIRHGFQGEQLCLVQETGDLSGLAGYAQDLLSGAHTDACLYGFVDAAGGRGQVEMHWITKQR